MKSRNVLLNSAMHAKISDVSLIGGITSHSEMTATNTTALLVLHSTSVG